MLSPDDKAYIQASYREARYPDKQVHILAQLYACPTMEIAKVLGLDAVPKRKAGRKCTYSATVYKAIIYDVLILDLPIIAAAEKYGIGYHAACAAVKRARIKKGDNL